MSSQKIQKVQNKLQDEIFNKIGLLLDKPISPKSIKQILDLINNASSPKQRIFNLILMKNRGQLIINMIKNYEYFLMRDQNSIMLIFSNLQKNIIKYEYQVIKKIWKLIIKVIFMSLNNNKNVNNNNNGQLQQQQSNIKNQQIIYRYGYEQLLRQGLRVTNLQKKDVIFGLIYSNVQLFNELGLKENIRKVIGTYIQMFIKYILTVPNYIKVLKLIIQLIIQSNHSNNNDNLHNNNNNDNKLNNNNKVDEQQQQLILKQKQVNKNKQIKINKLPQISQQYLTQIIIQLNHILIATTSKPLHLLHNQSLSTITTILSYKGNQIINNNLNYSLNQMLSFYLYQKPNRQQARKLNLQLQHINNYINLINKQKMIQQYSSQNISEQINSKPILIQNVINKTNQFIAKYHINNIPGNLSNINSEKQHHQLILKNSRFLKRGDGLGGGKAVLQVVTDDIKYKKTNVKSQIKKKDKFQLMLINCLQKCQWQKRQQNQNNNMVDQYKRVDKLNKPKYVNNKIQNNYNNDEQKPFKQKKVFNESVYSQFYEQGYRQQIQVNKNRNKYNSRGIQDNNDTRDISQDEINELIDLAYSYKFSMD